MNYTLTIIKPDAVARNLTGRIFARLEEDGFRIRAIRMLRLTEQQAREFYAVHAERPFFESLVKFMTSGPVVPAILERADGEDAVTKLRAVIGATDPAEAAPGTIRALFAESKERNAIHASDSAENAARESAFFFATADLLATEVAGS